MKTETHETQTQTVASLDQRIDQLEAQLDDASKERRRIEDREREIRSKINDIKADRLKLMAPFKPGDIVTDDLGVRYRVHEVVLSGGRFSRSLKRTLNPGEVYGIRLTATGNEAYSRPRLIRSSQPLQIWRPEE